MLALSRNSKLYIFEVLNTLKERFKVFYSSPKNLLFLPKHFVKNVFGRALNAFFASKNFLLKIVRQKSVIKKVKQNYLLKIVEENFVIKLKLSFE